MWLYKKIFCIACAKRKSLPRGSTRAMWAEGLALDLCRVSAVGVAAHRVGGSQALWWAQSRAGVGMAGLWCNPSKQERRSH